jgi:hypothetical protein
LVRILGIAAFVTLSVAFAIVSCTPEAKAPKPYPVTTYEVQNDR